MFFTTLSRVRSLQHIQIVFPDNQKTVQKLSVKGTSGFFNCIDEMVLLVEEEQNNKAFNILKQIKEKKRMNVEIYSTFVENSFLLEEYLQEIRAKAIDNSFLNEENDALINQLSDTIHRLIDYIDVAMKNFPKSVQDTEVMQKHANAFTELVCKGLESYQSIYKEKPSDTFFPTISHKYAYSFYLIYNFISDCFFCEGAILDIKYCLLGYDSNIMEEEDDDDDELCTQGVLVVEWDQVKKNILNLKIGYMNTKEKLELHPAAKYKSVSSAKTQIKTKKMKK